jgi:hypothetical protein
MTISDYALEHDGEIDIDVTDTELNILVGFTHTLGDNNSIQEKTLNILCENVKVIREEDDFLVCDFSGFFKQYNQQIYDYFMKNRILYIEDVEDSYLELVEWLPSLITGYITENTCFQIYQIFT